MSRQSPSVAVSAEPDVAVLGFVAGLALTLQFADSAPRARALGSTSMRRRSVPAATTGDGTS